MSTTPGDATANAPMDKPAAGAGLLLTLLVLANAVSFMDRYIFVLLLEPIRASLGLTDTAVSILQGMAFMAFYLLAAIPLGMLADRRRRVLIIGVGMMVWSAATLVCGTARTYGQLFLARMGVGMGEAALGPAAVSMISDVFPRRAWGRAIAAFSAGSTLGPVFAYAFGGYVIGKLPPEGVAAPGLGMLLPWQIVFILAAIPGLILAVIFLLVAKEPARSKTAAKAPSGPVLKTAKNALFGDMRLVRLMVGLALLAAGSAAVMAWSPALFIRVHHWSVKDVGFSFSIMKLVCGVAGIYSGGFLSDLLRSRGVGAPNLTVILWALPVVLATTIGFGISPDPMIAFACLAITTLLGNMCIGAAVPTIPTVVRPETRSTVMAFYIMITNLTGFGLAPTGVALINDMLFRDPLALGKAVVVFVAVFLPVSWLILLVSRQWVVRVAAEQIAQDAAPAA